MDTTTTESPAEQLLAAIIATPELMGRIPLTINEQLSPQGRQLGNMMSQFAGFTSPISDDRMFNTIMGRKDNAGLIALTHEGKLTFVCRALFNDVSSAG